MRPLWIIWLFLAGWTFCAEQADLPDDPYALLTKVRSFYSLFDQKGLSAYSSQIEIKGSIRQMVEDMAREKNLPPPEFMEFYIRGQGFKFILKNPEYPAVFRQIAGEMFTPVLAFDRLIQMLESKRDIASFEKFRAATRATAGWIQYQNVPHVRLQFTAKDTANPIETREVQEGASIKTLSTTALTFVISPENNLVKVLTVLQTERQTGVQSELKTRFFFTYQTIGDRDLPMELTIEKNDKFSVRFKALYRKNGKFIVFSRKTFQFVRTDNTEAAAILDFSDYKFNESVDKSILQRQTESTVNPERETAAEKLFNSAKTSIMDGKSKDGKKILKKILRDYPETSYAGQAKTLLAGLPE